MKKNYFIGIFLILISFLGTNAFAQNNSQGNCTIQSAVFTPSGSQQAGFIQAKYSVSLKITTAPYCIGEEIFVKIYDEGTEPDEDADVDISGIVKENIIIINYLPGDKECDDDEDPDCQFYAQIKYPSKENHTDEFGVSSEVVVLKSYLTEDKAQGEIHFDCHQNPNNPSEKLCDQAWQRKSISGLVDQNGNEITSLLPQGTYDTNSPCYDAGLNGGNGGYTDGCYELLAPIPGIDAQYTDGDGNVRDSGFIEEDGRQFVDTNKIQLGDYINQVFRIALGILMVIAVIMIIIAGVEYMTVESMFGKSAAKGRITNALTGLIIGLGIFLILSTINPKLLEVNFGKDLKVLTIEMKNDVQQREFIETTNTSGIIAPPLPEILEYEPLIGYLYHQQGPYGGPSTLWAAKNGYASVPKKTPFLLNAGGVQSNINAQFGTPMTPKDFVEKFYKILKAKEAKINTIPATNATAVQNAASDVGVSSSVLKTICMIESYNCTQAGVVNKYGYTGLFQFHPKSSWPAWRKNSSAVITKPYDNAYAGARFLKYNLQKYQKDKNKM